MTIPWVQAINSSGSRRRLARRQVLWLCSAVMVALAMPSLVACEVRSLDPTEQALPVRLVNDSGRDLVALQCRDEHCHRFRDRRPLPAGGSIEVGTSDRGVANPYVVVDAITRSPVGCASLAYPSRPPVEPRIAISGLPACPP